MLYHLKEPNYESTFYQEPVRFFARDKEHIFETLDYYQRQAQQRGFTDEEKPWWVQRSFSQEDIEVVDRGYFNFFSGLIHTKRVGDLFLPILITDEFTLYTPEEHILDFLWWRSDILDNKRGHLYKLHNTHRAQRNISFVPEDIAFALSTYSFDLYEEEIAREILFRQAFFEKSD